MITMSKRFPINQKLVNPRFESYKIISDDDDDEHKNVFESSFPLPGRILGARIEQYEKNTKTVQSVLGYKEIQDRARSKYLVSSRNGKEVGYIDENGFIILICFDDKLQQPLFKPIHRLQNVQQSIELPGLVSIENDSWLVSDGQGNLTLLSIQRNGSQVSGSIRRSWQWRVGEELLPFRILACSDENEKVSLLFQRTCKSNSSTSFQPGIGAKTDLSSSNKRETIKTSFELAIAIVDLNEEVGSENEELTIQSKFELEEAPLLAAFLDSTNVLLFSEGLPRSNSERKADVEALSQKGGPDQSTATSQRRIPPYAWTQTSETVTVAIKLPERTKKQEVQCHFTQTHLQLSLKSNAAQFSAIISEIDENNSSNELALDYILQGKFTNNPFWANVEAGSCVWTFEKVSKAGKEFNLLTLHLEKEHAGTRWSELFKQRDLTPFPSCEDDVEDNLDDGLEEVPETIDQSEMMNMLNGMEKYTTEKEGEIGANRMFGNNEGMITSALNQNASLLQDGLEEEDADVGQHCLVSLLNVDGSIKLLEKDVVLLANSLNTSNGLECVTIRNDLDGLVFLPSSDDEFVHADSIPALSYILASKRNCSKVYNVKDETYSKPTTLLAFDTMTGAQGQGGAGNLFVYYAPFDKQTGKLLNQGQSRVIRLGSGQHQSGDGMPSGPLIDVALLNGRGSEGEGIQYVLVLCQERLLILHNVL